MIHPQYWSLYSVYMKLRFHKIQNSIMSLDEITSYSKLEVKGKTVLDVGAYNGDSARLFLNRGAKKVVCIEKDSNFANKIKLYDTEVINEPFRLEHLSIPHDCMKMDIEGYEILLLDYHGILKPSVVEVHNWWLYDRFLEIGFRLVGKQDKMLGICSMINFCSHPFIFYEKVLPSNRKISNC